jgi:hypothetical protein
MKRDPLESAAAATRIEDRYDRNVNAVATQITVGPNLLAILKAVGALVFFDLIRAYEVSRLRRANQTRLWD